MGFTVKQSGMFAEGDLVWIQACPGKPNLLEVVTVEHKRIDTDDPILLYRPRPGQAGRYSTVRDLITEADKAHGRVTDLQRRLDAIEESERLFQEGNVMLSPEEESDVRSVLDHVFTTKPGVPRTSVLTNLWARLRERYETPAETRYQGQYS